MSKQTKKTIQVQIDSTPNVLNQFPEHAENIKNTFRQKLEENLDEYIDRYKQLPALMIHSGQYNELLLEARDLFIEGRFYSCVAMCGVTAERIAKELLNTCFLLVKDGDAKIPNDNVCRVLERIDMDLIRELLIKGEIVNDALRKPFQELAKLRNDYVHARGGNPEKDAKKAVEYLHEIIKHTISIFTKFEVKQGKLVPKTK